MDATKLTVFLGAFFGLLFVARKLSSSSESQVFTPPPIGAWEPQKEEQEEGPRLLSPVGAEIPFPIVLRPVERDAEGNYNRPIIRNYYFGQLDLLQGPPDPSVFFDDFYLELESSDTGQTWTEDYLVATPGGLAETMQSEGKTDLLLSGRVVIVKRWSVAQILTAILTEYLEK